MTTDDRFYRDFMRVFNGASVAEFGSWMRWVVTQPELHPLPKELAAELARKFGTYDRERDLQLALEIERRLAASTAN